MASVTALPASDSARPAPDQSASGFDAFVEHGPKSNSLRLMVRGAKCGGCLSKIEKAVLSLPGVTEARLNLSNGLMRVRWDGDLPANSIAQAVSNLGYGIGPEKTAETDEDVSLDEKSLLVAMGVAGFAAANIMLLSVSVWAGHGEMGEATRRTLHALSGIIALPVLLFSGRPFFTSALGVLRRGHANMDVPISLALCLAFGVSVFETINGGKHAYFDAAIMLLFFLLIGRFLEARLKRQAYTAANALAAMRNRPVTILDRDRNTRSIAADTVQTGDTIIIAPGERAMVDLRISNGSSDVDESLLTGESLPQLRIPGMVLRAGAINLTRSLKGTALGAAENSVLSTIADMLEAGEQRKSAYRQLADRAVSFYIPFVHTAAALAGLIWLLRGASVSDALMISVTTLIITCPCALALAAPVAQVVAAGRLFGRGIYLRSGDALERLAEIDHIAFDKTGTLTLGAPKLQAMLINGSPICLHTAEANAYIGRAGKLARASHHPLSKAIAKVAGTGDVLPGISETPGKGLEAFVNGTRWRLGSITWIGQGMPPANTGPMLQFTAGDDLVVTFLFEDVPQASATAALADIRAQDISLEIISGDRQEPVEALAAKLEIADWMADCTPEMKVARLELLRSAGHNTLMVGDGLNDTGALSLAHASLAPGNAMDISQSASDAVYCGDLTDIPFVLSIARQTRTVMRQNFAMAAGYNLVAVPIAVAGLVTPLIAAVAMSLSSIFVTLNALKLQRARQI